MASLEAALERWIKMDFALSSGEGLDVAAFAKRNRVSQRTVHRDISTFRLFGLQIEFDSDDRVYLYPFWKFRYPEAPLFNHAVLEARYG